MESTTVRWAEQADLEALLACDVLSTVPERRTHIAQCVENGECLLVVHGSTPVGFATLNHGFFANGFIPLVVVSASHRRRGIGLALLRAAEAQCRTDKLFSSTNSSNLPAQALLERAGFCRSGVIENLDVDDPEYIYFKRAARHDG